MSQRGVRFRINWVHVEGDYISTESTQSLYKILEVFKFSYIFELMWSRTLHSLRLHINGVTAELFNCTLCKYKWDSCVQVKNKPYLECTVIMRLISWSHSRGNETLLILYSGKLTIRPLFNFTVKFGKLQPLLFWQKSYENQCLSSRVLTLSKVNAFKLSKS
jgi:hypothetical protein